MKLGTRPQGGESKRSADNFGHCYLFDIWDLEFLVTPILQTKKTPDAQRRGFFVVSAVSAPGQCLIVYYAWAQEDQELGFLIYELAILEHPTQ